MINKDSLKNVIIALLSLTIIFIVSENYRKASNNDVQSIIINGQKVKVNTLESFTNVTFSSKQLDNEGIRYTSLGCLYIDEDGRKYEIFQNDKNKYLIFHYDVKSKEFFTEYIEPSIVEEILENL